jgi:hypothetical protein
MVRKNICLTIPCYIVGTGLITLTYDNGIFKKDPISYWKGNHLSEEHKKIITDRLLKPSSGKGKKLSAAEIANI